MGRALLRLCALCAPAAPPGTLLYAMAPCK